MSDMFWLNIKKESSLCLYLFTFRMWTWNEPIAIFRLYDL